jgi:hypothetical protein
MLDRPTSGQTVLNNCGELLPDVLAGKIAGRVFDRVIGLD